MAPSTSSATPRFHDVQCMNARGLHRMAYTEWGDPANDRVLVCVHGLTRQGRDFDVLARAMSEEFRVVCPDVVGRGRSSWLPDPAGYAIPAYVADMITLLARLNAREVSWVGTSMGGLIGLSLAAMKDSPIQRLVLNDVGPKVEFSALQRIGLYLGLPAQWANLEEAAAALWEVCKPFGPHSHEQWLDLCRHQVVPDGDGLKSHYDPAIAQNFRAFTPEIAAAAEAFTWASWTQVKCPSLLVRGAESDLFLAQTAAMMLQTNPRARLVEVPGVGHAPTLVQDDQVALVRSFLLESLSGSGVSAS